MIITLFVSGVLVTQGPPATWSEEALRRALLDTTEGVTSLSVEYVVTGYDRPDLPPGTSFHARMAAQAPSSFLLESGHAVGPLPWQDDPHRQLDVLDGSRSVAYYPIDRTFMQRPYPSEASLPGTLTTEAVLMGSGLWPCRAREPLRLQGVPAALASVARDSAYVLRPEPEQVDGTWCQVLEWPGRDVLWIDVERGPRIARRETRSAGPEVMITRLHLRDPFRAGPGTWLPRTIAGELVWLDERGEVRESKTGLVTLTDASTEALPVARFRFEPPDGALEIPAQGAPVQVAPGGEDLVRELAAWVRRVQGIPQARAEGGSWWLDGAALFAGIVAVMLVRAGARRKLAGPPARVAEAS